MLTKHTKAQQAVCLFDETNYPIFHNQKAYLRMEAKHFYGTYFE